jgi:hypothetical protein
MQRFQSVPNGGFEVSEDGVELSAAASFAIIWNALAEMLGTAATAAILRRAVGRAAVESPELVDLIIVREDLDYRYRLPHIWSRKVEAGPIALRQLVAETGRLLLELTGTVVISRLEQIPELAASGLVWRPEGEN